MTATATNLTWWANGGNGTIDEDGDGICDDVDPCVGEPDACGVCNGPGEITSVVVQHPRRRL